MEYLTLLECYGTLSYISYHPPSFTTNTTPAVSQTTERNSTVEPLKMQNSDPIMGS